MFEFMTPFPGEGGGRIVMFPSGPFLGPPMRNKTVGRVREQATITRVLRQPARVNEAATVGLERHDYQLGLYPWRV